MGTPNRIIIADSSALISLTVTTDSNHPLAKAYVQDLSAEQSVIVPSEIFTETLNMLGKKFGHARAIQAVQILADFPAFIIQPSSDLIRGAALDLFAEVPEDVSYADCLVMATAEQHGTVDLFGFDDIFEKRGFFIPAGKKKAA